MKQMILPVTVRLNIILAGYAQCISSPGKGSILGSPVGHVWMKRRFIGRHSERL